ncbi:hypothetical protein SD72_11065 [Leucobacter komagatae]|uniref:Sortase n=2 Tax=Leucobacter komagatae TaxID=55969 RepID=A0A0D0IRP8_9MICO|nr:hypothetical protein SD72_11065 [Leucobacter komagatae]
MAGLVALLYPFAADWVSSLGHNAERSGYVRAVSATTASELSEQLAAAREYNVLLPEGLLLDPYENNTGVDPQDSDNAYDAYSEILRLNGSGVIGEVLYPKLRIGLPLYHGAGEEAISRGVGHLYGSSMPVGGESTHAVLTSHSGLVNASLFTRLPQAVVGDTFQIRVLGESLYYRVDRIETVEPFVTDSLRAVEGEDRVTLFTCTPIGVNSHRLLVSGVRVAAPAGEGRAIAGDGVGVGFPWWVPLFLGGSAATAYLLFAPKRGNRLGLPSDQRAASVEKGLL